MCLRCKRTVEIIQTHLVYALNGCMHNGELSSSFTLLLFYSLSLFCSLNCFIFFHVSLQVGRGSFSVIHRLEYHFTCLFNVQRRCQHLHFVGSFVRSFFSRLGVSVLSIPNDRALKEASGSALLLCNVHMSGAVMENRICLSTLHSRIVLFLIASNCNCD